MAPQGPGWCCSRCGYTGMPLTKSGIPGVNWIWFAILLVFCFVICWVPLLGKEHFTTCPACGWHTRY